MEGARFGGGQGSCGPGDQGVSGHHSGIGQVLVGDNVSPRGQGYAFAGVMKFADRAACDAYATQPTHLELLEWLLPLIEPVELDFEAS